MAKVDCEEFLRSLESAQPGLCAREGIEQGTAFCFEAGNVVTYNEELCCRAVTPLDRKLSGAVKADKLLELLRKLPEKEVEVETVEGELIIRGKGRKSGFTMEKEILLPHKSVEPPKDWHPLADGFTEAVGVVKSCTGGEKAEFDLTCVHVHPKWVEACDGVQACRWRLKTGLTEPAMVRAFSLRHVVTMGAEEFCETENWLHFRRGDGKETGSLTMSCRRYLEEYRDLGAILKVTGTPTKLPEGLEDAADKASIFSSENTDANLATVELKKGKLILSGEGVSGWYREVRKAEWDGEHIEFLISPILFQEIIKRKTEVEISQDPPRLIIRSGKWKYVSCLGKPEENGDGEE
jgi:hypothetical protein